MNEVEAILVTAIFAAVVAVASIITQRVIARRAHTLDYLSRIDNDADLIRARKVFTRVTAASADILKFADSDAYDSDEASALRLILNENERLAVALQFGVLDRKFVARHCRGVIIRDWELAAPFIVRLRSVIGKNTIYREFEDLVEMLQGTRKLPRSYRLRLWF